MARSDALNLERISQAIDQHDANCDFPVYEIRMAPFEIERLGWEEIRGIPVKPDENMGTGRFRLVCDRDKPKALEVEEEVSQPTPVTARREKVCRSTQ